MLSYNMLNRTERITVNTASGRYIDYSYDVGGTLIRKRAIDNGVLVKVTDYIEGFVYDYGTLAYFGTIEGKGRNNSGSLKREYIIQDQQGNARVSFEEQSGVAVVRQEDSCYPFGLSMPGNSLPTAANKNLYNAGAEWQDDFGDMPDLQQTFYRMYDAALGRFIAVDPMAEASESFGTYHYAFDNPMGDQADPITKSYGGMHGGYGRVSPGSGNHWSDSIESALDARQTEANWAFWGKIDNLFLSGAMRAGVSYKATGNGNFGYWTSGVTDETGYSSYFNALSGKMEQSRNVGGTMLTWNEIGTNSVTKNDSNWAKATLGFVAADAAILEPTDAAWPKWAEMGWRGYCRSSGRYLSVYEFRCLFV